LLAPGSSDSVERIQCVYALWPDLLVVQVALTFLPCDVASRIYSRTTEEVHGAVWFANGELRRRPETAAQVSCERVLAQRGTVDA